ncbi:MAG: hypothetical protein HFG02_00570 [Oscillibacter sp.]|nr:hypothetical protein [Oscillibacter sp.]
MDDGGTIYVTDTDNGAVRRIRGGLGGLGAADGAGGLGSAGQGGLERFGRMVSKPEHAGRRRGLSGH